MLVLTRKPGTRVHIGADIIVTVLEVQGNRIRLGIEAPGSVPILREEIHRLAARGARNEPRLEELHHASRHP
jgi:carbon storage regulator